MRRAHLLLRANQLFCASFTPRTAPCVVSPPVRLAAADFTFSAPVGDRGGIRGLASWARGGVAACSGRTAPPGANGCCEIRWQQCEQLPQRSDQRRTLFGIPGNDDLSKQYKERRLVGFVRLPRDAAVRQLYLFV